jgi:tetratricopeptide (TPR) repeat protein
MADRKGDDVMLAVFWGNLSTVYESLGFFEKAADCAARAIRFGERSGTLQAKALAYARAASLAIQLDNREQARHLVQVAESLTIQTGVSTYVASAMVTKSEYLLAEDEPELAWRIVEELEGIVRNEVCAGSELAGLERLKRHWIFATQGYQALLKSDEIPVTLGLLDRLEIRGLREWAAIESTGGWDGESVLVQIRAKGLFGVIGRLAALQIYPGHLPKRGRESSAQLVARLFPDAARGQVPPEIPIDS